MEPAVAPPQSATLAPLVHALTFLWDNLNVWALLFAILTPALIVLGRQEIRMRRVRHIFDFEHTFKKIVRPGNSRGVNPSFEFVRSKYLSDLDIEGRLNEADQDLPTGQQLQSILGQISMQGRRRDIRLLGSSIVLVLILYIGFDMLIASIGCGFRNVACSCASTVLAFCSSDNASSAYGQLVVIGALAFAGAFVAAIRAFLRSLAVFDLSAYTFLRQTGEIVAAIIFTMIAYAAFSPANSTMVPRTWIALAPILGLMPSSATRFVLTKMKNVIPWFKTDDNRFEKVTRITTIDAIDGIDFATRFRLEECGIYDVQNLACANPIMLHIESPFGIYQCIDWVAQAQLCHILGLEKFLLMRELNIRTIFDLERAIDSHEGPDEIDTIYAGILFASTNNLRASAHIGGSHAMIIEENQVRSVSLDEYCIWARKVIGTDPKSTTKCIEHVMRWIGDDLHVRRLRLIWNDITASLGEDADSLMDSKARRSRLYYEGGGI